MKSRQILTFGDDRGLHCRRNRRRRWDEIGDNIGNEIRDDIRNNIGDIRDDIGDGIGDEIGDNIRDDIRVVTRDKIGDYIRVVICRPCASCRPRCHCHHP